MVSCYMMTQLVIGSLVLMYLTGLSAQLASTDPPGTLVSNGGSDSPFNSTGFTFREGSDRSAFDIPANRRYMQADGAAHICSDVAKIESPEVAAGEWCLMIEATLRNAQLTFRLHGADWSIRTMPRTTGSDIVKREVHYHTVTTPQKLIITAERDHDVPLSATWTAKVDNIKYMPCGMAFQHTGASISPFVHLDGPLRVVEGPDKPAFNITSNQAFLVAGGNAADFNRTRMEAGSQSSTGRWCLFMVAAFDNARLRIEMSNNTHPSNFPFVSDSNGGAGPDGYHTLQYNYTSPIAQRVLVTAEKLPGSNNPSWSVRMDSIQYKPC